MDKDIFEKVGKYGFYIPIILEIVLSVINLFLHSHLIDFIKNGLGWILIWNVGSYYIFWLYFKVKPKNKKDSKR